MATKNTKNQVDEIKQDDLIVEETTSTPTVETTSVKVIVTSPTFTEQLNINDKFDVFVDLSLNDIFKVKNSYGDRYTRNPVKANGSNNFSLRLSPEETILYSTKLNLDILQGYCVIFNLNPVLNFNTDFSVWTTIVNENTELDLIITSSSRKEIYIESGTLLGSCIVVKQ